MLKSKELRAIRFGVRLLNKFFALPQKEGQNIYECGVCQIN